MQEVFSDKAWSLILKLSLLLQRSCIQHYPSKLLEKKFPYYRKPSQRLTQWATLESQRVV